MTQGIRPDGQIFASEASDGELENFPAPLRGWGVTTDGKDEADNIVTEATNGIPPMEWDNGQRNKVDNNIWWLMQHAIPEWHAGTWDAGAFVIYSGWVYYNNSENETNEEPLDGNAWVKILCLNGVDSRYYPGVGEVKFYKSNVNPEVLYPGTVWEYLGENISIRTAKTDASNVGALVGTDSVILSAGNLPAHAHSIGGNTSATGNVSATTSSNGAHTHTYSYMADTGDSGDNDSDGTPITINKTGTTSSNGAHVHTVTIPGHSHSLPVSTGSVGSGAAFSIVPASICLAAWVRVS